MAKIHDQRTDANVYEAWTVPVDIADGGPPDYDPYAEWQGNVLSFPEPAHRKEVAFPAIELTVLSKINGPLTKRINLTADGLVHSDGSACKMAEGFAERAIVANVEEFATLIGQLRSYQAIALGALRDDLADKVKVTTKDKLNGEAGVIARTANDIVYREQQPAWALLDFDQKGTRVKDFWGTLTKVLPPLRDVARVLRRSTSSGLFRSDTGEVLPGSGGWHGFVAVQDGNDVERFLYALHDRAWLAGYGWFMIGKSGLLLERSIVDRSVGASERLVFEGSPIIKPPLKQDAESRRPITCNGGVLDTKSACRSLTKAEQNRVDQLKEKARKQRQPEADKVRAAYIAERVEDLVKTGIAKEKAVEIVESQSYGKLLPEVVLQFVDKDLKGCTVSDVLADPDRFAGKALADPIEGVSYGRATAMIMCRRDNGEPWIKSFAHGGVSYSLAEPGWHEERIREIFAEPKADSKKEKEQLVADFPLIDIAAWHGKRPPDRDWIAEDRVPARVVTGLYGDGGVGKTILLLQLAVCVVLGIDWLGAKIPIGGPVLIMCCEDDEKELWRRLDKIIDYYNTDFATLKARGFNIATYAGKDASLVEADHDRILPTPIYLSLRNKALEIRPRLIGIDNLADVFAANEVIRRQVRQFVTLLHGLALELDNAVLLTAHPSLGGLSSGKGTSGSTGWNNAFRSRMYFRTEEQENKEDEIDRDYRELEVMKANYGPTGDVVLLRWQDGKFVPIEGVEVKKVDPATTQRSEEEEFLMRLDESTRQGRPVSDKPRAGNYAPAMFARDSSKKSRKQKIYEKAMERLFLQRRIRNEPYGRPSQGWVQIVRAETFFRETADQKSTAKTAKKTRKTPLTRS